VKIKAAAWAWAGVALALAPDGPAVAAGRTDAQTQVQAGAAVYARCAACHALSYDRTGPRHCGLFGRPAGSVKGFDYSEAMKRSGIVWDEKTLDLFLSDPVKTVPGTTMGYAGVKDGEERSALIAYLKQANESPECGK
jgi:cytochrome c